jgi:hypothetical protein
MAGLIAIWELGPLDRGQFDLTLFAGMHRCIAFEDETSFFVAIESADSLATALESAQ